MSSPGLRIRHILCPTDLSEKSQAALSFAAGIAARVGARLTACHCASPLWLSPGSPMTDERRDEIEERLRQAVIRGSAGHNDLEWNPVVIERSYDPAAEILELARTCGADLMVMKARRSVFSAFHFGSIVERVTSAAQIPVLILPAWFAEFLLEHDIPADFHQVLFDYDFSEATDKLFPSAMALTEGFHADLHLLSVMDPEARSAIPESKAAHDRFVDALRHGTAGRTASSPGDNTVSVPATVEWGAHAETVLSYASTHEVDLICTTLSPPFYYFERLYCAYLGKLLQAAKCPILALRAV